MSWTFSPEHWFVMVVKLLYLSQEIRTGKLMNILVVSIKKINKTNPTDAFNFFPVNQDFFYKEFDRLDSVNGKTGDVSLHHNIPLAVNIEFQKIISVI